NHQIPTSAPTARPHTRPIAPPSTNRPPILVWIRRCSGVSRCLRGGSSFMDEALPDLCLARTQDRKEIGHGDVEGPQSIVSLRTRLSRAAEGMSAGAGFGSDRHGRGAQASFHRVPYPHPRRTFDIAVEGP